jgi:hypothetical protein
MPGRGDGVAVPARGRLRDRGWLPWPRPCGPGVAAGAREPSRASPIPQRWSGPVRCGGVPFPLTLAGCGVCHGYQGFFDCKTVSHGLAPIGSEPIIRGSANQRQHGRCRPPHWSSTRGALRRGRAARNHAKPSVSAAKPAPNRAAESPPHSLPAMVVAARSPNEVCRAGFVPLSNSGCLSAKT